jgi:hypothetical protein
MLCADYRMPHHIPQPVSSGLPRTKSGEAPNTPTLETHPLHKVCGGSAEEAGANDAQQGDVQRGHAGLREESRRRGWAFEHVSRLQTDAEDDSILLLLLAAKDNLYLPSREN